MKDGFRTMLYEEAPTLEKDKVPLAFDYLSGIFPSILTYHSYRQGTDDGIESTQTHIIFSELQLSH